MKFIRTFFAAVAVALVLPVVAPAQPATNSVQPTAFDRMKANVGKIPASAEKARWQANVALWEITRSHTGALTKADIDKAKPSHEAMKSNVAAIAAADEKERWQANCDLWQVALNGAPAVSAADKGKMQTAFATLKRNVAAITEPAEQQRWQANRDLWKGVIDKM